MEAGNVVIKNHDRVTEEIAFSPDGRKFASSGGDGRVKIVDVDSLEIVQTLDTGERPAWALAFSPDGGKLAVGSLDKRVTLWDLASGERNWAASGHGELIASLAFSPDGSRIATASWDKSIRVWDAATGHLIARLFGHEAPLESVAFLGDADRIVSIDRGGALKMWDLSCLRPAVASGAVRRRSPCAERAGVPRPLLGFGDVPICLDDRVTGREKLGCRQLPKGQQAALGTPSR
jgi:WD40 repeat protein